MKKGLIITAILLVFFNQWVYTQKTAKLKMPAFPVYEVVINKFLLAYSPALDENQPIFALAKKPDGWHAMTLSYPDNKIVKDELFWSLKEKKYINIDFPENETGEIDPAYEYLRLNNSAGTFSALVPYWGYDGWETDVISEFAGKSNLSDTLLNAVARSYSSKAKSLISYSEFGSPDNYNQLPKGQNALKPDLLNNYLNFQHLAIDYYYKLYKQNSRFETFVSNSYNVYSNEILNGFLALRYFQNEETAKKELKPGLYDGFYLEMAKNYLNSCDLNSILFTNGDMDTYPLLYVQENENFRKDVMVVNLSLLNLGRYINHLANFKAGAKPLFLGMDTAIYKSETKPYIYVQDMSEEPIAIKEMLNFVASDDPLNKIQTADNLLVDYIQSKNVYFDINFENIKNEFQNELNLVDTAIHIKLDKNYLTISEFCILDIIASNNFERPVYFATTVGSDNYFGLEDYFQLEGLAYKLTPVKKEKENEYTFGYVQSDILYNKCFKKLSFIKKNYHKKDLCNNQKQMINNFRGTFARLARQFLADNKPEMTLSVLDKCIDLFPADYAPYNYSILEIITDYFKIGQNKKAKSLIENYLKNLVNEAELLIKLNKDKSKEQEIRIKVYFLNELAKISEEYIPEDELNMNLKEVCNKYKSYGFQNEE